MILPTRLEFDASGTPKNCNDAEDFKSILSEWVRPGVLHDDAERRLVVRIRSSSTGRKQADVSLVNTQGVILAEEHARYAATQECHKVLWAVAKDAARLMGAFEPPPPPRPPDPTPCPLPSPRPLCPPARPYPTYPSVKRPAPMPTPGPTLYRFSIGLGAFAGSGTYSQLGLGPYLMLGFVPTRHLSHLHVEFEGAWTSQASESIRMHSIPLVGSLCLVRGIVRFCGGLATTLFFSNQSPDHDELHLLLSGNFRVGTELLTHGPFSIRADAFGRFPFVQRHFGQAMIAFNGPSPIAAGLAVMGAWSLD